MLETRLKLLDYIQDTSETLLCYNEHIIMKI